MYRPEVSTVVDLEHGRHVQLRDVENPKKMTACPRHDLKLHEQKPMLKLKLKLKLKLPVGQ